MDMFKRIDMFKRKLKSQFNDRGPFHISDILSTIWYIDNVDGLAQERCNSGA